MFTITGIIYLSLLLVAPSDVPLPTLGNIVFVASIFVVFRFLCLISVMYKEIKNDVRRLKSQKKLCERISCLKIEQKYYNGQVEKETRTHDKGTKICENSIGKDIYLSDENTPTLSDGEIPHKQVYQNSNASSSLLRMGNDCSSKKSYCSGNMLSEGEIRHKLVYKNSSASSSLLRTDSDWLSEKSYYSRYDLSEGQIPHSLIYTNINESSSLRTESNGSSKKSYYSGDESSYGEIRHNLVYKNSNAPSSSLLRTDSDWSCEKSYRSGDEDLYENKMCNQYGEHDNAIFYEDESAELPLEVHINYAYVPKLSPFQKKVQKLRRYFSCKSKTQK